MALPALPRTSSSCLSSFNVLRMFENILYSNHGVDFDWNRALCVKLQQIIRANLGKKKRANTSYIIYTLAMPSGYPEAKGLFICTTLSFNNINFCKHFYYLRSEIK